MSTIPEEHRLLKEIIRKLDQLNTTLSEFKEDFVNRHDRRRLPGGTYC